MVRRTRFTAAVLAAALAAVPVCGGMTVYASDLADEALTAETYEVTASGTLGTCTWTIENGTLTIAPADGSSGTLATHAWNGDWYEYSDSITAVVVEEGVKAAADSSYLFSNLQEIYYVQGITNLDTSDVTTTEGMFYNCRQLCDIDLSGFDTYNLTNTGSMFEECLSLETIDLSSWYTANVTTMAYMFYDCSMLITVYVGDYWSTANVTDSRYMMLNCTSIVGGLGTTYQSNHVNTDYARADVVGKLGYFTYKEYTGSITYPADDDTDAGSEEDTDTNTETKEDTDTNKGTTEAAGSDSSNSSGQNSNSSSSAKAQKITIKKSALKKTVKAKKLKKKAQSFKLKASSSGNGKITYKKVKGSAKIKISKKGKVTLKKGLKKGTYKVKVKISAAKTGSYKAASVTKTLTVKVK